MLEKLNCYVVRVSIFLIMVALIAGMAGCSLLPPQNLEIRTWYDLDAVRNNLGGHYILMNDLNYTTAGYTELASPTANGGKGWQPIGTINDTFHGSFDGQGYEIHDLFINRPAERNTGLFGAAYDGTIIKNLGVVNTNVTGQWYVGTLVGTNYGTVSGSYSSGNVTGEGYVGGLVGGSATTVSNSYSASSVTGNNLVGGLVGGNTGTVSNSYATGNVTGNSSVGGLVGHTSGGTVSNCFWNIQTSGQATSDGGTGKSTAEMKDVATFSGAAWNVIAVANPGTRNPAYIWNIINGVTYPFLSWQP